MGYTGGMHTPITILAIAGSLRAASLNTALLRAIAELFGVDREYLVPGNTDVPARITAQLEAVKKLRAAKVKQFATRTLGDMSPEAVAAIGRILDEDAAANRP